MWPFKQKQRDLEFIDTSKSTYMNFPVMRARDVPLPCYEHQKKKFGKATFPKCPGMIDYAHLGYIIPAWVDMHFMANKAGIIYSIGSSKRGDAGFQQGRRMEPGIVDGILHNPDVDQTPVLFGAPWQIFTPHNMSALLLPPIYHGKFTEDLHVWPGVVDYNKFHTVNFVVSAKRECNVTIKAGEPLLHVIPLINQEFNAGYGPPTPEQEAMGKNQIPSGDTQYYRKFFMTAKKYFIQEKNT